LMLSCCCWICDILFLHPFPMPSGVGFLFGWLDVVNLTPKQEKFAALQLDRNFKPLTLDQMRELEPTVFARAGV